MSQNGCFKHFKVERLYVHQKTSVYALTSLKGLKTITLFFFIMYLVGSNVSENKAAFLALQSIYGVGENTALAICNLVGISSQTKISELNAFQLECLTKSCRRVINRDKKRQNFENIKKLVRISSYRGTRHFNALPCRGQRTRTNAKTAKNLLVKARTHLK